MKQCIKCGLFKEMSEFYANHRMTDGHLNECKSCTKDRTNKDYRFRLANEPGFAESETIRSKDKYNRLYSNPEYILWQNKNGSPQRRAHNAAQHLIKPFPEAEAHHWSYNEQHWKDVIWLTEKDKYKMYIGVYYDVLLDTKAVHLDYINWCILNLED